MNKIKTSSLKIKAFFGIAILSISTSIFAHPGHDHNAADAGLVHLLWLAPAIIAMGVISYRKIKTKSDKK
jgi:hypothetical protein